MISQVLRFGDILNRDRLIFGFLVRYTKFWFCIIFSDLNPIYKIPKFNIASAHPINLQSFQIPPSRNPHLTIRIDQVEHIQYIGWRIKSGFGMIHNLSCMYTNLIQIILTGLYSYRLARQVGILKTGIKLQVDPLRIPTQPQSYFDDITNIP